MKKRLEACSWYHGSITRMAAEMSLGSDGDFLVRDCISSPGNYVLTSKWKGQVRKEVRIRVRVRFPGSADAEFLRAGQRVKEFDAHSFLMTR